MRGPPGRAAGAVENPAPSPAGNEGTALGPSALGRSCEQEMCSGSCRVPHGAPNRAVPGARGFVQDQTHRPRVPPEPSDSGAPTPVPARGFLFCSAPGAAGVLTRLRLKAVSKWI